MKKLGLVLLLAIIVLILAVKIKNYISARNTELKRQRCQENFSIYDCIEPID